MSIEQYEQVIEEAHEIARVYDVSLETALLIIKETRERKADTKTERFRASLTSNLSILHRTIARK